MTRPGNSGRAPTQRQLRVGEVVRRALADVLIRGDVHEPGLMGASITVSEVRMSPDLRLATAYVMPLGGANLDATLAALGRARRELRRVVGGIVNLRYAPDLLFVVDETYDRMDAVQRLLDQPAVKRDL